jgi:hypothetical protein
MSRVPKKKVQVEGKNTCLSFCSTCCFLSTLRFGKSAPPQFRAFFSALCDGGVKRGLRVERQKLPTGRDVFDVL